MNNDSKGRVKKCDGHLNSSFNNEQEEPSSIHTSSGIPVESVYNFSNANTMLPGIYPFTRGIHSSMYRSKLWSFRQYAGFGSAAETNTRLRYLLKEGQTALSIAFDLPTQIGYDSDHPLAVGEVGKVGVSIDSLADMELLFESIPLDKVSTSMTINAPAAILLCMYVAGAEKKGIRARDLSGTIQNDILKEYVARGTYIYPPKPSMRLTTNLITFCTNHLPKFHPISISGYHMREAGATAVQEIAFTFANAKAYIDEALKNGEDIDNVAARLSFFFSVDNEFFEEVAKFRAARRLWAKIIKEDYKASKSSNWKLRFHAQTAGSTLTSTEPENNVTRVSFQALAAVLGGTQSLHTNSKDEALALPSEGSVRTALRTQQIIANEIGVIKTADPLGGSYYIEYLTDEIEARVNEYLTKIAALGGAVEAIETGFIQQEINKAAFKSFKQAEEQKITPVGIGNNQIDKDVSLELHENNPLTEKFQLEQLIQLKQKRDNQLVHVCLANLKKACDNEQANLVPFIMEAVKAYCTVEEISTILRSVFGEYEKGDYLD
ncbi:acyl-CoA mutase large subunit family protein [Aquibacillus saliphilus]|uniref:acyl-CoA mutase large subunit family protein n=1 Tax=Aquibacillus saliphilus TaxID=1909422 RepID=UPI001CF039E4|nr:methylmalonyl-CoA mutase family protein [Aquibacillus saliphilus]